MAADRSRLAAALAYKQAEEERRRRMMESVPGLVTDPAQTAPRADFRTNLENLSIGLGEGLTNQLEGVKGIITDPVGTARGVYEAGRAVIRDPSVIADALRYTADKAMSGPLGAGEVIGEMLGPRKGGPVMRELDVYHGTPHRFPATEANPLGEFDASKIGTGEGAQAFGHGIYYAENPGVAKSYQFVNAKIDPDTVTYNGKSMQSLYDAAMRKQTAAHRLKDEKSIQKANAELAFWEQMMVRNHPDQVIADVMANPEDWPEYTQFVKGLDRAKFKNVEQAGHLYKADLPDEMIDRMLDWDKPLSEQPTVFKELMKVTDLTGTAGFLAKSPEKTTFGELYNALKNQNPQSDVSEYFRKGGIPGIKYLDAGSRGQGGSGTRNFVVFPGEEKKVRILERDGQKAPPQKIAQALEAAPDYRMTHRPMGDAGGASRLHNAYESFGEDIYGPKALQYFGGGDPREAGVVKTLKRLRDNPDAEVTIYRGVPKDAVGDIGEGDWVTLDRSVAAEYGEKVLAKKVKAKDITTWPDSLLEFGYYPVK